MKLVAIYNTGRTYPIEYSSKEELVELLTTTADRISKMRKSMVNMTIMINAAETKLHDLWDELSPVEVKDLFGRIKQLKAEYESADAVILDIHMVKCGCFSIDAMWKVNLPKIYTIDEWFEALKNRLQ